MTLSRAPRTAYTLLEVLLASAIGVLLMGALYVGMDVQLRSVQAGREKVNETAIVRNLISRMSADAIGTMTPILPTVTVASTNTDETTDPVTPFNGGVQGDNQTLILWVSRLPKLPTGADAANSDTLQMSSSDEHRIAYWVGENGLLRQDVDRVSATSDDPDAEIPPSVSDETKYTFAPEVTDVQFRYFDGEAWQDTWDGTVIGADGKTPTGPPRAIEVTLSIRRPGADPNDQNAIKQYRQVIPINAGNGLSVSTATTTGTGTTGTSTTGGTSP
jgi:type II secretory pathway component PulJ